MENVFGKIIPKNEFNAIQAIVNRACKTFPTIDRLTVGMDITAVHTNGCPLDLIELLKAESVDFIHDIVGIMNHIDRNTGHLKNYFRPRYSKR